MLSNIQEQPFGITSDRKPVYEYTLSSEKGLTCKILNYGGIIRELWIPDKEGNLIDVVLGFDTLEEYEKLNSGYFFGCVVGRYANRIANGRIQIYGKTYQLPLNDGNRPNTLHGGKKGFHTAVFDTEVESQGEKEVLVLKYLSPDCEEGFPGNLDVTVKYTIEDLQVVVEYFATTDKPTVVNMTQHSYFNLSTKENILDHYLAINSDFYTPVDENLIPTGEIKPVEGTNLDFRKPRKLLEGIEKILKEGSLGYDHNFVINGVPGELRFTAKLYEEDSGICMEVYTTQPGVQLYTANYLSKVQGKRGKIYNRYAGLCLETQNFPDAPNHENFPSALLLPVQVYYQKNVYKFGYIK